MNNQFKPINIDPRMVEGYQDPNTTVENNVYSPPQQTVVVNGQTFVAQPDQLGQPQPQMQQPVQQPVQPQVQVQQPVTQYQQPKNPETVVAPPGYKLIPESDYQRLEFSITNAGFENVEEFVQAGEMNKAQKLAESTGLSPEAAAERLAYEQRLQAQEQSALAAIQNSWKMQNSVSNEDFASLQKYANENNIKLNDASVLSTIHNGLKATEGQSNLSPEEAFKAQNITNAENALNKTNEVPIASLDEQQSLENVGPNELIDEELRNAEQDFYNESLVLDQIKKD
jgi:hypothetical protein